MDASSTPTGERQVNLNMRTSEGRKGPLVAALKLWHRLRGLWKRKHQGPGHSLFRNKTSDLGSTTSGEKSACRYEGELSRSSRRGRAPAGAVSRLVSELCVRRCTGVGETLSQGLGASLTDTASVPQGPSAISEGHFRRGGVGLLTPSVALGALQPPRTRTERRPLRARHPSERG